MFVPRLVLVSLVTLFVCACSGAQIADVPIENAQVGVFSAHRGDRSSGPDNSRSAILSALRQGFPYVEVDVRPSSDGELFLFHERQIRIDGVRVPVSSLASEKILRYRHPQSEEGLLTLAEALRMARPFRSILQLDLKDHSASTLRSIEDELALSGMSRRVVAQAATPEQARWIREYLPSAFLLARIHHWCRSSQLLQYRPEFVQLDADAVTSARISELKRRVNARVLVKTLTSDTDVSTEWRRLFRMGVDIVLSDRAHPRLGQ